MNTRLAVAFAAYFILGLLAAFTLDGDIRIGVLVILGLLAFKSWLVVVRRKLD